VHILVLSLLVAFLVCVFLLGALWVFTVSPFARHAGQHERQQRLNLG
jgi:uncharacterized BrkB/YihY/UPF0761 family membrane protein